MDLVWLCLCLAKRKSSSEFSTFSACYAPIVSKGTVAFKDGFEERLLQVWLGRAHMNHPSYWYKDIAHLPPTGPRKSFTVSVRNKVMKDAEQWIQAKQWAIMSNVQHCNILQFFGLFMMEGLSVMDSRPDNAANASLAVHADDSVVDSYVLSREGLKTVNPVRLQHWLLYYFSHFNLLLL